MQTLTVRFHFLYQFFTLMKTYMSYLLLNCRSFTSWKASPRVPQRLLSFSLGNYTSFLLTHRPQSDKLLQHIPVWAAGGPPPPPPHQTHRGGLPICRSDWNIRVMDPPHPSLSPACGKKGLTHHPNKSVTSPEYMHLLYT